ncbi:hypothetical protein NUACC21_68920 [Scytonema sp. NUACC21]
MTNLVHQLSDFATKNPVGIVILAISGIIGTILGFVGIWLSVIAWQDSQRSKKELSYLFKVAELNIDKSVTEEEIAKKRQVLDNISDKVISLQNQIKKEIPIEARRAVLLDRLNSSIEILTKYHRDVKQTQQELERLGNPQQLPKEVTQEIEAEIQPRYLLKEKISRAQTLLSTLTGLAAITSAILPNPFDDWVRNLFLIAAIIPAIELFKLNVLTKSNSDPLAKRILVIALLIINVFVGFVLIVVCLYVFSSSDFSMTNQLAISASAFMGILMTNFISGYLYKRYVKRIYLGSDSNDLVMRWMEVFFDKSLYFLTRKILKRNKALSQKRKQNSRK